MVRERIHWRRHRGRRGERAERRKGGDIDRRAEDRLALRGEFQQRDREAGHVERRHHLRRTGEEPDARPQRRAQQIVHQHRAFDAGEPAQIVEQHAIARALTQARHERGDEPLDQCARGGKAREFGARFAVDAESDFDLICPDPLML